MSDPTPVGTDIPRPKLGPAKQFNILLVGETGVGKSTFINAFVNYMTFKTLDDAINSESIVSMIPSRFTVTNEDLEEQLIVFGEDVNESQQVGASATQSARSYKFPVGNAVIRLIDTPGIGDTRGINKDEENFDRLLTVIGELKDIHAICIMLKPNNARLTVLFEYCVKQLLSRLQRSASKNIVFLFTNSRSTFYRVGDTLRPLKKILKEIESRPPNVVIPFHKHNVFCMDNEAFRFLVANKEGVQFSEQEKEDFSISWNKSADVCLSLIDYVVNAKPHKIQDTVSINEARRLILRLSLPLAQVAENIDKNLIILERRNAQLTDNRKTIDELKKLLYVPVMKLKITELPEPRTVCTDGTCTDVVKVEGVTKIHYRTICHNPCYLREVPKEIIGSPELIYCAAIQSNHKCKVCGHSYLIHMHIYYITETYPDKIVDSNVGENIKRKEITVEDLKKTIKMLEERKEKYKHEQDVIQKSMAKFAHFLKNNAITVYNDKYKEYIEYLISKEQSYGEEADKSVIANYRQLMRTYQEHKTILDDNLNRAKQADDSIITVVTAEDVLGTVKSLYNLELTGPDIRDFYDKQRNIQQKAILTKTERVYRPMATVSTKALGFFGKVAQWFTGENTGSSNVKVH